MTNNKLGNYLRHKREEKGFTQAQVAQKLGYGSPQFISNIERGISRVPVKSLKYFIALYELRRDDLVDLLLDEKRQEIIRQLEAGPENALTANSSEDSDNDDQDSSRQVG